METPCLLLPFTSLAARLTAGTVAVVCHVRRLLTANPFLVCRVSLAHISSARGIRTQAAEYLTQRSEKSVGDSHFKK